ncbi:MAG: hypothetical protein PUP91_18075 [Rhizonema sp. PD37]|nr:hypothetical protein [Rhizonema sp. PD37]
MTILCLFMQFLNITLPDAIANALKAYISAQEVHQPETAVVETALTEFLSERGYLPPQQEKSLRLTPAPKGSGFQDTSVNYDKIIAEHAFKQKLPPKIL